MLPRWETTPIPALSHQQCQGRGHNTRGRGNQFSSSGWSSSSQSNNLGPTYQVCNKNGHMAIQCYHRFDQAFQGPPPTMAAYLTVPSFAPNVNWYPNIGSTNHLTRDL